MRDKSPRTPASGTEPSPPQGRHGRIFDILCHAERAQHTAARTAGPLDDETGAALRRRALASLKVQEGGLLRGTSPRGLRKWLGLGQKKAAASSPTVIAPTAAPVAGSVTAKET